MRAAGYVLGVMFYCAAAASAMPVRANLRTELDSRWSKVGDPVEVKLEAPMTFGSSVLPKGALLLGRVQQVTKKNAHGRGELSLVLDRAQMEDGQSVPIAARVVSVSPSRYQEIPDTNLYGEEITGSIRGGGIYVPGPDDHPRLRTLRVRDGESGRFVDIARTHHYLTLEKGTLLQLVLDSNSSAH